MAKRTIISARRARRTKTVAGRRVVAPAKRKAAKSPASKRSTKVTIQPPVALQFTRVSGKVKLTPPPGYMLSVLLKQVERNETHRIYAWWVAVGRYDLDTADVSFNTKGVDVIRCDVPPNFDFKTNQIEVGLTEFFKTSKEEKPKLVGGGDGTVVTGPGGSRP